jgi:hypothetical protein
VHGVASSLCALSRSVLSQNDDGANLSEHVNMLLPPWHSLLALPDAAFLMCASSPSIPMSPRPSTLASSTCRRESPRGGGFASECTLGRDGGALKWGEEDAGARDPPVAYGNDGLLPRMVSSDFGLRDDTISRPRFVYPKIRIFSLSLHHINLWTHACNIKCR